MLKIGTALSLLLLLSACTPSTAPITVDGNPIKHVDSIETLCLNGVEYYFYRRGYKAGLAVVIDKNTLQPKLCSL